jgi:hypothetical protein
VQTFFAHPWAKKVPRRGETVLKRLVAMRIYLSLAKTPILDAREPQTTEIHKNAHPV